MNVMLPVDNALLQQLERYVDLFAAAFRRREQARWAGVYLQGLLLPGVRKSAETLAEHVTLPADLTVSDRAQALQNFINQSPWDEQVLWQRLRAWLRPRLSDPEGVFVVTDLACPKQGAHSVGVLRQYSSAHGRKINCQIAVALHYVGPAGYCPLTLRLYLPRKWLEAPHRLETARVPPAYRHPAARGDIALALLDQVRREGFAGQSVAAGPGYAESADFQAGLAARGLALLTETAPSEVERWRGLVERGCRDLLEELGLTHFEGRSWRGFHHHACLVMMAYAFRYWRTPSPPN